jgi:hypothetical protein
MKMIIPPELSFLRFSETKVKAKKNAILLESCLKNVKFRLKRNENKIVKIARKLTRNRLLAEN